MHTQNTRANTVAVMLDGSRRNRDRKMIMKNDVSYIASVTLEMVVMLCARGLRGIPRTLHVPDSAKDEIA